MLAARVEPKNGPKENAHRHRPVRITEGLPWLLLGELLPVSCRVCFSGSLTVRHPSYEAVGCPESSVSPFSWATAQERHEQNAVDERGCFPFPFPYDPIRNGKRNGSRRRIELIAVGRFYQAAVCNERCKSLTDIAGAHAHDIADLLLCEGLVRAGEGLFDPLQAGRLSGWSRSWLLIDDLQGERWGTDLEYDRQPVGTGSGALKVR
jgi:hypothetical protein